MLITVNGEPTEVADRLPLAALLPADPRGTAVAVNDEVVARDRVPEMVLIPGDRVEIVQAVQGG